MDRRIYLVPVFFVFAGAGLLAFNHLEEVDEPVKTDCERYMTGFDDSPLKVESYRVSDHGLELEVVNSDPDRIELEKAGFQKSSQVGESQARLLNQSLDPGEASTVVLPSFQSSGSCNTYRLTLTYAQEQLEGQKVSGELSGRFSNG